MFIKWISLEEAENLDIEDVGGLGGFTISIDRKDYINMYRGKYKKYIKLLFKEILDKGICFGGDYHQMGDSGCPVIFKNNKPVVAFMYSYRAWGDLMHSCIKNVKGEKLGYMQYYMDTNMKEEAVYP